MCTRSSRVVALVLVLCVAGGAWANLVGYWKLDEGSGTVAKDSSGNGNDGTLEGNPTWVDGQYGKALAFSNSRVTIPASNSLGADMFKAPFTMAAWINPTRAGNTWQQVFRAYRTDNASNDTLFINNDGRLSWRGRVATAWAGGMCETAPGVVPANQWTHVAATGDATNFRIYVNGVLTQTSAWQTTDGSNANYYIGGDPGSAGEAYAGMADDVRVYNQALTAGEVVNAMKGKGPGLASEPSPVDTATDVPADSALAWKAGDFAATHDVYLGTSFTDVNTADRVNPGSVLASRGQTEAQYDPEGLLAYGQTYYWRIDEVNAPPDSTIYKGDVWSFTVEPYSYPVTPASATASSSQANMGPENTINGSGLTGDLHGTEPTTMWLSAGVQPNWIQYEFDQVYKLDKLLVWNSNQLIEGFLGFGAKTVTIETSTDGTTWAPVADVPQFNQAPGAPGYAANTTVSLGGVDAKYVKLTITANWGGVAPPTGLAEVRFFYVPVQARLPQPASAATGVSVNSDLNWRPGREATSHQVYIGTDSNAVADGAVAAQTVTEHSYTPGPLDLGTTYYWKVDEVGDAGTYAGNVWSFTTEAYTVVDDFESYTADAGEEVFSTWIDGFDNPSKNGAIVGLATAVNGTFCDTTIFHGGKASMPFAYDNSAAPLSEAVRTFAAAQDWTAHGVKSLSLWIRGVAGNKGQLYVKINSAKVVYDGAAGDLAAGQWLPWNIDLSGVSTTANRVTSLTIGVDGVGATGTLNVDDIRLYPQVPQYIVPVQPDQADLVARYTFDGDFRDAVGTHHGTTLGNAKIASDPVRGQVLSLDGSGDAVDVPYSADLNPAAFTVSLWANPSTGGTSYRSPLTSRDDAPQRGYIIYVEPGNTWQFWTGTGSGWNNTAGPAAQLDEWTHVAASFVNNQKVLYINGRQAAQSTAPLSPNTQRPLRIGGGATESTLGNYFFLGLIDEVRLYRRALSPEEVAGLTGRTEPLAQAF